MNGRGRVTEPWPARSVLWMTLNSPYVAFEIQPALVLSLSVVLAAIILFDANRLLRRDAPSIHRGDALKIRIVVVAFAFIAGGIAILIATTEEPGAALMCAERCGAPSEPMALLPNGASR